MAQLSQLPRFVLDLLAACPAAGAGVHRWLFCVARVLHPFYADKRELAALVASAAAGCGRDVPTGEIDKAVANSEACAWQPGDNRARPRLRSSKWPEPNLEQIEAIAAAPDAPRLADLWDASPVRCDEPMTESLVDALFPGNPLLCCSWKLDRFFDTGPREEWRGQLDEMQFIVPSPMSAVEGRTQEGKLSPRSLDNTGPRRFLVIEFDSGEADTHAAVLWHLARLAPLALVVHSGGKSLHGWFACAGEPEDKLHKFMRYAVLLGADPATWTRCQLVRMPDGLRPMPRTWPVRQHVFHFNPANLP